MGNHGPVAAGGLLRHTSFVRQSRHAAPPIAGSAFFYVHHDRRLRRCGITSDALRLLAADRGGVPFFDFPKAIFERHEHWIRALALVELREREGTHSGTLLLTETNVRFQLACDSTPELPDVFCI
jgi:hypothetical protein